MSSDAFDRTNLGWWSQQTRQQVQEWMELKLSSTSDWSATSAMSWLLQGSFWLTVVLLAIWLGWLLYRLNAFLQANRSRPRLQTLVKHQQQTQNLTAAEWLRRAQLQHRQGDDAEACRSLYMAMLQRLDDTKQIPYRLSRTNGEYLQLIETLAQPRPYQILIDAHERLCFDKMPVSLEVFQRCQVAYQEIAAQ
jgi:hypothetical protein